MNPTHYIQSEPPDTMPDEPAVILELEEYEKLSMGILANIFRRLPKLPLETWFIRSEAPTGVQLQAAVIPNEQLLMALEEEEPTNGLEGDFVAAIRTLMYP